MSRHIEAFEDFASRVSDFDSVRKVILFGSVARQEHGARSDVDVLVEVEDMEDREEIEETAFKTASSHGVSITPIVVLKGRENSFIRTVEREGKEYVRG